MNSLNSGESNKQKEGSKLINSCLQKDIIDSWVMTRRIMQSVRDKGELSRLILCVLHLTSGCLRNHLKTSYMVLYCSNETLATVKKNKGISESSYHSW